MKYPSVEFSTKDPKDMTPEELDNEVAMQRLKDKILCDRLMNKPPKPGSKQQNKYIFEKLKRENDALIAGLGGIKLKPATK